MNKKNDPQAQGSVFHWEGIPSGKEVFPLAIQHVVAMVVGCVTPAIMVANVTNANDYEATLLVQSALLIAGIATLLQLFPIGKATYRIGSGLPLIMGVGFAYVPALMAIGKDYGIAAILGAQMVGGLIAIVFGLYVKKILIFFPPMITGTVVFTIGLSLYPTAIKYMAGGAGNPDFGSPKNWMVALITLAIVIIFNHFTKGFFKLASILIGIIFGYAIAYVMGMVSFESLHSAGWFNIPAPMHFGLEFEPTAIISMIILYLVNSVQAIGDMSATTSGAMDRMPNDKELSGGIISYGLSSVVGAMFGGLPTATFSQNVGIITTTKVINRFVLSVAAGIILVAGFVPKFSALLTTIPQCVLGGATITVFASITMTGIKLITKEKLTQRNMSVIGLSVALGVGVTQVPEALALMPGWVTSIFGNSSTVVTTIMLLLLNGILPKDKKVPKTVKEKQVIPNVAFNKETQV